MKFKYRPATNRNYSDLNWALLLLFSVVMLVSSRVQRFSVESLNELTLRQWIKEGNEWRKDRLLGKFVTLIIHRSSKPLCFSLQKSHFFRYTRQTLTASAPLGRLEINTTLLLYEWDISYPANFTQITSLIHVAVLLHERGKGLSPVKGKYSLA